MDEEQTLLAEWQAARQAHDELLAHLFVPVDGQGVQAPDSQLLEEAGRLRSLEEAAWRRYHASRGADDGWLETTRP